MYVLLFQIQSHCQDASSKEASDPGGSSEARYTRYGRNEVE